MKITSKIDFKSYLKLVYYLTYKKITTIILLICGTLMLMLTIFNVLGVIEPDNLVIQIVIMVVAFLWIPSSAYFSAKRTYASIKSLNGTVEYEISETQIKSVNDESTSTYDLNSLFKIVETNNWFLIYPNKLAAYLIPKNSITPEQTRELRYIFSKLLGVKAILKLEI